MSPIKREERERGEEAADSSPWAGGVGQWSEHPPSICEGLKWNPSLTKQQPKCKTSKENEGPSLDWEDSEDKAFTVQTSRPGPGSPEPTYMLKQCRMLIMPALERKRDMDSWDKPPGWTSENR